MRAVSVEEAIATRMRREEGVFRPVRKESIMSWRWMRVKSRFAICGEFF